MTGKILKSTERGQITLPKKWRANFPSNHYFVEIHEDTLIIRPLKFDEDEGYEVLFNADRDNSGKGVPVEDMIAILENMLHG